MKQTRLLTSLYRAQKQYIETRVSLEQTSQIHSNLPEHNRAEPIPVPRAYYSNMTKHAQQSNVIGCIHLLMPEEDACLFYMALLSQAAFQKMF